MDEDNQHDQLFCDWLLDLNQRRSREGRPKLTKEQEEDFVEHMQRLRNPDGHCLHCEQPASQYFPTGPIVVSISEPDDKDKIHTYEFCNWECLGHWAAKCAGGTLIIDRN